LAQVLLNTCDIDCRQVYLTNLVRFDLTAIELKSESICCRLPRGNQGAAVLRRPVGQADALSPSR
jgi:hypothetical protein